MGGENGASQLPSLAEQKSEVWEKTQEIVRSMIQMEAEMQKILENKKGKELRLDEVKCLEKTIENKIGEATNRVDAEEAKQDKSRLHAELAALVEDIKADLIPLMQLKHSLRDLKEQDLELASKAEDLTDQELSLSDSRDLVSIRQGKLNNKSNSRDFPLSKLTGPQFMSLTLVLPKNSRTRPFFLLAVYILIRHPTALLLIL